MSCGALAERALVQLLPIAHGRGNSDESGRGPKSRQTRQLGFEVQAATGSCYRALRMCIYTSTLVQRRTTIDLLQQKYSLKLENQLPQAFQQRRGSAAGLSQTPRHQITVAITSARTSSAVTSARTRSGVMYESVWPGAGRWLFFFDSLSRSCILPIYIYYWRGTYCYFNAPDGHALRGSLRGRVH